VVVFWEPVVSQNKQSFLAGRQVFWKLSLKGMHCKIVKVVKATILNLSKIGLFVESIKTELSFLRCASFVHVSRKCNEAAHVLAKEASSILMNSIWLEEIPSSIASIVLREQVGP
jgi:hypothetical protein